MGRTRASIARRLGIFARSTAGITIDQADSKLRAIGYAIVGDSTYDPATRSIAYTVRTPAGATRRMTPQEIKALIRGA